MERSIIQPNPGWGTLCEACPLRFDELDQDFPCSESDTADLVRYKRDAYKDLGWYDRLGIEYDETCDRPGSPTKKMLATFFKEPEHILC